MVSSILNRYVGCGQCPHEVTVRDALDVCFASWPQHDLVAFRCASCGGTNHLEVRDGMVAEGDLHAFPGPSLLVKRRLHLHDFHVRPRGDRIEIHSLNLRWAIKASAVGS